MTYQGSKEKYAKHIVPILNRFRTPHQTYWEPFFGSGSIMQHMGPPRIGTDIMEDLIMLWKDVINDTFIEPSYVTKEMYDNEMSNGVHSSMRAYIGFFWSFSGMFNKGYSPEFFRKSHSFHKMRLRAVRLRGSTLCTADYRAVGGRGVLIYADPPYRGTTTYRGVEPFDHEEFYKWCQMKAEAGNTVIVSEYEMPKEFKLILEMPATTSLGTSKREKSKPERLYTL